MMRHTPTSSIRLKAWWLENISMANLQNAAADWPQKPSFKMRTWQSAEMVVHPSAGHSSGTLVNALSTISGYGINGVLGRGPIS